MVLRNPARRRAALAAQSSVSGPASGITGGGGTGGGFTLFGFENSPATSHLLYARAKSFRAFVCRFLVAPTRAIFDPLAASTK